MCKLADQYWLLCFRAVCPVSHCLQGDWLQRQYPDVLSFSDFVGLRFGRPTQLFTCALTLFNMSVGMIAEFTTMGALFKDYVGTEPYTIILLVAVSTLAYTAYGGLEVSIVTDRIQAISSMTLVILLVFYCGMAFRPQFGPLTTDLLVGEGTLGIPPPVQVPLPASADTNDTNDH